MMSRSGQALDGTFSISRSRKLTINPAALRQVLLDERARSELFPGQATEMVSKPSAKTIRIEIGPGVAGISVQPSEDDTTRISVEHKRLPDAAAAPKWQEYWATWLDGLSRPGGIAGTN
jgi:hypothetical protein